MRVCCALVFLALVNLLWPPLSTGTSTPAPGPKEKEKAKAMEIDMFYLDVGSNIGHHVATRVQFLLSQVAGVSRIDSGVASGGRRRRGNSLDSCLVVTLGDASDLARPDSEFESLPSESFAVRVTTNHKYNSSLCRYAVMSNGHPLSSERHKNISFDANKNHYGAILGSYASLELLGFSFLHPLEPYVPLHNKKYKHPIGLYFEGCNGMMDKYCEYYHSESPYWPERSFHLHTQHPLELNDVLQGHDIPRIGPTGSHCINSRTRHYEKQQLKRQNKNQSCTEDQKYSDSGHPYCERWEDMLDDVSRLFEWAIANRLNKLEWLLLGSHRWINELDIRFTRFKQLTELGHQYSLLIGVDIPIGNIQQHAWYMVDTKRTMSEQFQQIRDRVDWVFRANFDFLTTESGLSEFTHPECEVMLGILNEFANYVNGTWGREASIKVHCSTGQVCKNFLDPITGKPINFNFLTLFATPKLGVFPHTIQLYSLDDPTGNAYGNKNFSYMEDYLVEEAKLNNRSVVYYGETAYWVNVDSDVPLFLPLYGQRRLYDLRKIALREKKENFRIQGQMNFDSGWEWGYWLSDVVTARASWDPLISSNFTDDNYDPKQDEWSVFKQALRPFTKIFVSESSAGQGNRIGDELADILVSLSIAQSEILIYGKTPGRLNNGMDVDLRKLSGIPYLSGDDTWIDLPRMFGLHLFQPDKIHLQEVNDDNWSELVNLLSHMDFVFGNISSKLKGLYLFTYCNAKKMDNFDADIFDYSCTGTHSYSSASQILFEEIIDSADLLSLRAKQVHILYESQYEKLVKNKNSDALVDSYKRSRDIIAKAQVIVKRRESLYRVPPDRIAAYRENPTVYRYGYVWSVRTLFYWWRDQGIAEGESNQSIGSPCYLNRMDATEVAIGRGKSLFAWIRRMLERFSPFPRKSQPYPLEFINCLAPPDLEYKFPRDL